MKCGMRLVALALVLASASCATLGPITPDNHPSTRLSEAIRKMRLSLDRELLALARLESLRVKTAGALPVVERQQDSDNDDNDDSSDEEATAEPSPDLDDGFSEVPNDGNTPFQPIRPGASVPPANVFPDGTAITTVPIPAIAVPVPTVPEPSESPVEPSPVPIPVVVPPVVTPTGPEGTDPTPGIEESVMPSFMATTTPFPGVETPEPNAQGAIPDETMEAVPSSEPNRPVVPVVPVVVPDGGGNDSDDEVPVPATPVVMVPPGAVETPSTTGPPVPGAAGESPSPTTADASESPDSDDEDLFTPDASAEGEADGSGDDDDDGSVCFPADATVEIQGGLVKRMAEVELGDLVRVGDSTFSEVFMFTHKMSNVLYNFVRIRTESGHVLTLTKSHYLYVNGSPVAASTIRLGDSVMLADHTISSVSAIENVRDRGLYNPQTVHGDIVVNGVRATTYTTAIDMGIAHALLTPLRAAYASLGWSLSAFDAGADRLATFIPSGSLIA